MGPLFDAKEEDIEQYFDEDSRPVSRQVLVEEYEDEYTTDTPEYETPRHVPIKDVLL